MELASVTGKCNFPSVLKGLSLARNLDVRMLDSPVKSPTVHCAMGDKGRSAMIVQDLASPSHHELKWNPMCQSQ